ncbi:MAG: cysteine desulfurase activator complex subunit SufB [candidate division WS6 bacterium OLB21]|uniref:Cysteine desulfurase activator complex subunit SufB n=1 Tax=candidate division WS6 bacterium OLB21 TaxID=1617427 RepID=A0A136KKS3_9BACT|nr:MAG: cysteine desulfurase activator complex subunit SufB [candidate division WS6 bacterium OLB21]
MSNKNLQQQKTNASDIIAEEVAVVNTINSDYEKKYGFKDNIKNSFDLGKGINKKIIKQISKLKNEDDWMLNNRLKAYDIFLKKRNADMGRRFI